MSNILVLSNKTSGLYNFRKEVMKAIVDAGYNLFISIPDDDERAKYFESIGCRIIKTRFDRRGMNPLADMKLMLAYRKLIMRLKPAAVLTYTIKPNIYGGMACRLCGVAQIANITGLGDAVENGGWLQKLTILLYKMGIGKARRVFFQNQSNRNLCIKLGIANEKSVLLPGSGVNLRHHTMQPYPANEGRVRFLFIGRLLKDKGIREFFDSAQIIKNKYPNTEFQVLGRVDGTFHHELEELVKQGVVNHLGETTDVRPYIGAVDCTVMPSYHEGMSNVNLESSANGRPVITTNVPGCVETVEDGKTGLLIPPHNTESLVKAMEHFINMPYTEKCAMGQCARNKVENEFDRQIVVNAYLKAIESIAHV